MNHWSKRWTDEQKQFVQDNYKTMTDEEIGKKLGKTPAAIWGQRRKQNLLRVDPENARWKQSEVDLLYRHRGLPVAQIANIIYWRSANQIQHKMRNLLRADPEKWTVTEEQPHITDWKSYKPSYKSFTFDDDLILAVKIQQLLAVNYGRS